MPVKSEISNSFNRIAREYQRAAKVQAEIGTRLFERLDYLKINPRRILDLGAGTGLFSHQLQKKYPKAQIISLDIAFDMLCQIKRGALLSRNKINKVNACMQQMPFTAVALANKHARMVWALLRYDRKINLNDAEQYVA